MPDFLVGNYATPDMFKPGYVPYLTPFCCSTFPCHANIMVFLSRNEEMKTEYFSKFPGACGSQSEPVAKAINGLKAAGHNKVAVIGYCWGYKTAVLSEAGLAEADAFISVHPT